MIDDSWAPEDFTLASEDYARAERFLHGDEMVFGADVHPSWSGDGRRFWYRSTTTSGHEFVLVDVHEGQRRPAFDHARLAAALSVASGGYFTEHTLPFDSIELSDDSSVRFGFDGEGWECNLETYRCKMTGELQPTAPGDVPSPDGQRIAYVQDGNLKVRERGHDGLLASTTDATAECQYATALGSPLRSAGIDPSEPEPPLFWSPDGRRIITHRINDRHCRRFHLVQSVHDDDDPGLRLHTYTYPLPGDEHVPRAELVILDVERDELIVVDVEPLTLLYYGSPLQEGWTWWSEDSSSVYVIRRDRGYQAYDLYEIDADTGESTMLIREESEVAIDPHLTSMGRPNVRVLRDSDEVLWFSLRDGWGHLYLYDAASETCKRQLTRGSWCVLDIEYVDQANRMVYFTGLGREAGRDPYYSHLYRVSLDGGEPELLTPEDATHRIRFSPDGEYYVDSYSRVDLPPVTVLKTQAGETKCLLEQADISQLEAIGWQLPERFKGKARDGVTDIYGIIFRPSHCDGLEPLPVVDDIYGGPQTTKALPSFGHSHEGRGRGFWQAQALAELGFVVVMIDGFGMPYRSKAFHNVSFRNLADGGIPDHIHVLRQLADRYPYLDLERAGIYGHSAGGYASARAILDYPDFFKVAVSSAGNHDHGLDKAVWIERYMGLPVGDYYQEQANASRAHQLQGKLLLIHGEMDENVHVASTMRLVDALIEANKDFDMLIMPNRPHACTDDPYFVRKRWDYFVRHLLGIEPPQGYRVGS